MLIHRSSGAYGINQSVRQFYFNCKEKKKPNVSVKKRNCSSFLLANHISKEWGYVLWPVTKLVRFFYLYFICLYSPHHNNEPKRKGSAKILLQRIFSIQVKSHLLDSTFFFWAPRPFYHLLFYQHKNPQNQQKRMLNEFNPIIITIIGRQSVVFRCGNFHLIVSTINFHLILPKMSCSFSIDFGPA